MAKCPICGGSTKCPAGRYLEVRELEQGDVLILDKDVPLPPNYIATHRKAKGYYAVPLQKGGYRLLLVGTAQAGRIKAHYGAEGRWVGTTTYAFWVVDREGEQ